MERREVMPTYNGKHEYNGGGDTLHMGWYDVVIEHARTATKKAKANPIIKDMVAFAEALPHGSGIDGDWHIQVQGNGNVVVTGEYHHMNNGWYYDGWSNFKLWMSRMDKDVWNPLKGPCEGQVQRVIKKGDVVFRVTGGRDGYDRDYFHECLYDVMRMVEGWNNGEREELFTRERAMELGWDGKEKG